MSEAYLTNWSFGGEIPDTRNCFHETALREAQIATDYHSTESSGDVPALAARASIVARLRNAFARPATIEDCGCAA